MSISIKNIYKSYNGSAVLRDYSLELADNGHYAIVGASGIGKTTLLRLISRLEPPDKGSVSGSTDIAAVFQEDRLVDNMSAVKNVAIFCPCERSAIMHSAARLGLEQSDMDKKASELSGGQRQRVAILRAVLSQHSVLLLDEPFRGLDGANKQAAIDYILRYHSGMIVLITHDLRDSEAIGAQLIRLEKNT